MNLKITIYVFSAFLFSFLILYYSQWYVYDQFSLNEKIPVETIDQRLATYTIDKNKKTVLILGSSHINVLKYSEIRKLVGDESPEVAQSLEGLALNLFDLGNFNDSVSLMREALSLRRGLHDGPHPELAETLNNLGFVLGEVGEYRESELLFREALEMKRQLFGDAHPEIAMGMNNVAIVLHDHGEFDAAERMYRDAIDMQRQLLGEDHPDVALALNNLSFLLYDKDDLESAIPTSRESLDMLSVYAAVTDEHEGPLRLGPSWPSRGRGLR